MDTNPQIQVCYNKYMKVIQPKLIGGIEMTIINIAGLVSLSSVLLILTSRLTVCCDNEYLQYIVRTLYFLIHITHNTGTVMAI